MDADELLRALGSQFLEGRRPARVPV